MEGNAAPQRVVLSVAELVRAVRRGLEDTFANLWVEGEISGGRRYGSSGHYYFTLKDEKGEASLSAVCFASSARLLKFKPEDGLKVLVRGRITVYEARGQMQMVAEVLEPAGLGALQLAYEQLKQKLAAEGLFEAGRKRELPAFPRVVGVVTSAEGAAVHDVLRVLKKRGVGIEVRIAPSRVQGEGAAESCARALALLNRQDDVDLILVTRGGGSLEDLWAFNEEVLVRAVAASRVPVLNAVGHEVDTTLCDLAADACAPTPSAAAERLHPSRAELLERLAGLRAELKGGARHRLREARLALERLGRAGVFRETEGRLLRLTQRVDHAEARLRGRLGEQAAELRRRLDHCRGRLTPRVLVESAARRREQVTHLSQRAARAAQTLLAARREQLASHARGLDHLSPVRVLGRGYALCRDRQDHVLMRKQDFAARKPFRITVSDGDVEAIATGGQDPLPF